MTDFDGRTAIFLGALLNFVLPANTWMALIRQNSPAVALWCGGGLLTGLGLALIGLRGTIPDAFSYTAASTVLLLSGLLRIQSLRLDLGRPWPVRWLAFATLLWALIFQFFYWRQDVFGGLLFRRGMTVFLTACTGVLAWKIARKENSSNARAIAAAGGLLCLLNLYLCVWMVAGASDGQPVFRDPGFFWVALFGQLAILGYSFSYVGLVLERSLSRRVSASAEHARAEATRLLGEQLEQLEQQSSLGVLSASLGHELNQPLTAVLTNAQVALRALQTGRPNADLLREYFDKIASNTRRASQIIESNRSLIRPSAVKKKPVNLDRKIARAIEYFESDISQGKAQIFFSLQAHPVWVLADPVQLHQVLLNVLRNAVEAMKDMVTREIRVSYSRSAKGVTLTISDTGPGLSPEVSARVWEPFFTTKVGGLGMGLPISQAILAQFGGTLTLRNASGAGAMVQISLPALPGEPDEPGHEEPAHV